MNQKKMLISKKLLEKNDPVEFLKLGWAISPERVKGLLKLQLENCDCVDYENMTPSNFQKVIDSPKFKLDAFQSAFQSNSNEFVKAYREGKFDVN